MKKIFFLIATLVFSFQAEAQKNIKKLGLIFDNKTYCFGDVEQWNNQPAVFTFTNNSKMSLTILPLFSENDLDVVIPDKPIQPGETITIKAMYYTDGKGPFSRSFPIYFGFRAEPVYLKITGNIKSLSPEAYIQCPMAKPELSKPKIELVGDVAELDSEFPISGATIEIIGLQNKKEVALFSSSKGKFGAKLPTGNYLVKVNHPNYTPYTGTIYIGRTSPPLRIRLQPKNQEPLFVQNTPKEPSYEKRAEEFESIASTNNKVSTTQAEKELGDKVPKLNIPEDTFEAEEETTNTPKPSDTKKDKLDRPIDYVKNEPKDNPYSREESIPAEDEIPQTLTTYKTNEQAIDKAVRQKPSETEQQNKPTTNNTTEEEAQKPKQNENKTPKLKEEKPAIPTSPYDFRVIDKNSLEAIEDASIFLADLYDKRNKHKGKTDIRGVASLDIVASDYRFLATADGYISNEIKISKDDKSSVYKIFLTPVSDLYDEIYEAKQNRAKENEELLSKLSFGKTEFSFAKDEPKKIEKSTKEKEETPSTPIQTEKDEVAKQDKEPANQVANEPVIVEKIIVDKAKEDSLQQLIAKLEAENKRNEALAQEKRAQEIAKKEAREKATVDSLQQYIAKLQAKNDAIETNLDKIALEKEKLKEEQRRDKEKLEALAQKEAEKLEAENLKPFSTKKYQANNIMFLIDISNSMEKDNKIEMLKTSIKNLVGILRDIDRVAIITYNQKTNIVLQSIPGDNKNVILEALDSLKTGGLTNGVRGITTAYDMLEYYFIPNGNNQIILATDGLFSKYNNEMTENELNRLVKKQAEKNMKLSVVGFGKESEGKNLMGKLAQNGKGQYIQIYNDYMTRDVLIKEIKLNSEIKTK